MKALQAKFEVVTSALHMSQERVTALEERNHSLEKEIKSEKEAASSEYKKIQNVGYLYIVIILEMKQNYEKISTLC